MESAALKSRCMGFWTFVLGGFENSENSFAGGAKRHQISTKIYGGKSEIFFV
jgi:hypothetical protein